MKTDVLTPMQIFNLPQRLVVPLFQRKYVWTQEDQWELLWDDIRRLAELRLADPSADAQHFLGAAVLQEQFGQSGLLPEWTVIDGQQRLTTLQIIIDAAAAVLQSLGQDKLARQMNRLTENSDDYSDDPDDRFKVLPTHRDRAAFQEVMAAPPPIEYTALRERNSLIVRAHEYFSLTIHDWIGATGDDGAPLNRAEHLAKVLQQGLQLVIITLGRDEDAQEIFETLNARGTPLTAADLIKNFVFRRLTTEGADIERAYRDYWLIFENAFWGRHVSVGQSSVVRSSLFMNQWLGARLAEEVSPRTTFSRFKYFVEHEYQGSMLDLLSTLHRQAELYQHWIERSQDPHADLDPIELFVYRTNDLEFVKPLLLWVCDVADPLPPQTANAVIAIIESWVMRRALLGLSTSDLGRVVAELIGNHRALPPEVVAERVAQSLSALDRTGTYWPGDEVIRRELAELPAYRRFRRGRLRVFLEAAEDALRGYGRNRPAKASNRVPRWQLQVEHLLPQQWRANWPVDELAQEIIRDDHVHRLGNLTLITGSLNAAVSNGPWLGNKGKLEQIDRHDVLLLNRWIKKRGTDGWNEALIDQRTQVLADALIATWPVPDGHLGVVVDAPVASAEYIEIKQLIAAGILTPGTELLPRSSGTDMPKALIRDDGALQVGEQVFESPSGAGRSILRRNVNGWSFWRLDDGRSLADVRREYLVARTDGAAKGNGNQP